MANWSDIPGYEGLYQASDNGYIRSLPRQWVCGKNPIIRFHNGVILQPALNKSRKRYSVCLRKNGHSSVIDVHLLVWMAFNGVPNKGIDIDHINGNSIDNRLENLQPLTRRQHITKTNAMLSFSSSFHGVLWNKQRGKWQSRIWENNKQKHIGFFDNELDAHNAYQNRLNLLTV